MARVTLLTIAQEVGVSRTTVSNAYSRPNQLTPELRQRIFDAAERLGYRGPNAAARMLRTGRMGTIGLVFSEDLPFVFSDPNTRLFMQGVAADTSEASTALTLLPVSPILPLDQSAVWTTPVDGYLLFSVADGHPVEAAIMERSVPVVVVDEPDPGVGLPFIGIDDRAGAQLVGAHIASLGHSRVAIVAHRLNDAEPAGPATPAQMESASVRVARERYAGYMDGLGGIEPLLWSAASMTVDGGRQAVAELFAQHPDITAIICMTDQIAIGATQALTAAGRRVPVDVSVAGFDDIPRARAWEPSLTTLRQPLLEKGRIASRMLREMLDGEPPRREILDIELIIRDSTGPAPA